MRDGFFQPVQRIFSAKRHGHAIRTCRQGYFFLMAFAAFVFIISFDYQELHFWNYPFYGLIIILLVLAFVIGHSAGGAQRWINLGFFKLQPSEPAKLMLVITLASYYSRKEIVEGYTHQGSGGSDYSDRNSLRSHSPAARFGNRHDARHHFCVDDPVRETQGVDLSSLYGESGHWSCRVCLGQGVETLSKAKDSDLS